MGRRGGLSHRRLLLDVGVGVAFAVLIGSCSSSCLPWTALAAVLLGAALAVRRLAPVVMTGLAVAASVVQVVSGNVAVVACAAYVPLF